LSLRRMCWLLSVLSVLSVPNALGVLGVLGVLDVLGVLAAGGWRLAVMLGVPLSVGG
jgi:hypothetical protein